MLKLGYDGVHRFAEGHPGASWDGWTLVMWKADNRGATSKNGAFIDGQWGIQTRIDPNEKGVWGVRA